jgi:hypothetical protein
MRRFRRPLLTLACLLPTVAIAQGAPATAQDIVIVRAERVLADPATPKWPRPRARAG